MSCWIIHLLESGDIEVYDNLNRAINIGKTCIFVTNGETHEAVPLEDIYVVELGELMLDKCKYDQHNTLAHTIYDEHLGMYTFETMRSIINHLNPTSTSNSNGKKIACTDRKKQERKFTDAEMTQRHLYGFLLDGSWFENDIAKRNYDEFKQKVEELDTDMHFGYHAATNGADEFLAQIEYERNYARELADTKPACVIPF